MARLLAGALLLACGGCGDDSPVPTDVSEVLDEEADGCCSAAECIADGLVCDAATCLCVPAAAGCAAGGEACDPAIAQPEGWVCVGYGQADGVCRTYCATLDDYDPCPSASVCVETERGSGGYCAPSQCEGFFGGGCGEGEKCVPVASDTRLCFGQGPAALGEACEGHADCQPAAICVAGACLAPDCSALTAVHPCPAGQLCGGFIAGGAPIDIGECFVPCDPFAPSQCDAGGVCTPDVRDGASGALRGRCGPSAGGTAAVGAACATDGDTASTCVDGSVCLDFGARSECVSYCDPAVGAGAPGSCATGEACRRVAFSDGTAPDWGVCDQTCIPFASTPGDCPGDELCAPDFFVAGAGFCTPPSEGQAGAGDACDNETPATRCGADLFCVSGRCGTACDPSADAGAPGSCSSQEGCSRLLVDGPDGKAISLAVGLCVDACVYDRDHPLQPLRPCQNGAICQPAFLFGGSFDVCVDAYDAAFASPPLSEFDPCPSGTTFDFCRPGGVCLSLAGLTEGVECLELCGTDVGACGSRNHPDCSRPVAVCQCVFADASFGVCGNE